MAIVMTPTRQKEVLDIVTAHGFGKNDFRFTPLSASDFKIAHRAEPDFGFEKKETTAFSHQVVQMRWSHRMGVFTVGKTQ
jgi:hypothetical protein